MNLVGNKIKIRGIAKIPNNPIMFSYDFEIYFDIGC